MKKMIINVMATTGITLIVLALIGTLYGAKFLFISGVFQSLGANIVMHLGLIITGKFESKYPILEAILDISYTIVVLIIFGAVFNWYRSTPIWILIIMAVIIYSFGCLMSIFRMREDVKAINELLQKRNKIQ
jgi:hypothetical protein